MKSAILTTVAAMLMAIPTGLSMPNESNLEARAAITGTFISYAVVQCVEATTTDQMALYKRYPGIPQEKCTDVLPNQTLQGFGALSFKARADHAILKKQQCIFVLYTGVGCPADQELQTYIAKGPDAADTCVNTNVKTSGVNLPAARSVIFRCYPTS